jgi:mono/diheme cytochrome c family protein
VRCLAFLALLVPSGAVGAPLYTASQAVAGAGYYANSCDACHGGDLRGVSGPPLVGAAFAARGDGYTVGEVFNQVWEGTPAGAPDSLSPHVYVDVMAYLLARNGYAAGRAALTFAGASNSAVAFYSLVT